MEQFIFHGMTLQWLEGGITNLDGGTMFGVVPKPVWSKKYPVNELNQIELPTHPILIRFEGKNLLIDSGVGNGKLTDKQKRNYGVTDESHIKENLESLNLSVEDIDYMLMTHLHFDHACGLTEWVDGELKSVFPNAKIIVSDIEWNEMREPNIRSKNTYWKENWEPIEHQVQTFTESMEVLPGIEMIHTGGHSDGHSIVKLTQNGDTIIHMGDIMPTHAHQNPLWVLAFDDYPMASVFAKERLMKEGLANGYWFSFYHDAYYRLIKWDEEGKNVIGEVKRQKEAVIR